MEKNNELYFENKINAENKLERNVETKKIFYLILIYSIPIIFSMLIGFICAFLDRYWMSRLPENISIFAIAGIGISMVVTNSLLALVQLVGIGASACISIYIGKNDKKVVQDILNNGINLCILISIIILLLSFIFIKPLLYLVGASENTIPYALEYSKILIYSFPFYILAFFLSCCISATGKPKIFAITQLISIVTNIILAPIFVFYLDLKVKGLAISTAFSQFIWFVCILFYYLSGRSIFNLKKFNFKLNFLRCKNIIGIGISPFFLTISNTFVMIILNNRLKYYGDIELSSGDIAIGATSIMYIVLLFFLTLIMGINQGTQPLIGFNYGKKDFKKVKEIYIVTSIYCITICLCCLVITTFFGSKVASIFSKNTEVIKVAAKCMKIFLAGFIFSGLEINTINLFQAMGKGKISMFLIVMKQVMLIIPCYIFLPKLFGLTGIWLSGPVVDIVAILITSTLVFREFKSFNKNI